MLAPDLVPHYLGKTPMNVRARRDLLSQVQTQPPTFQIPKFGEQFKIPALPTPELSASSQPERQPAVEPPRGRKMKSLVLNVDTQMRHDDEIVAWLSARRLTPRDLVHLKSLKDVSIDDPDKLRKIMSDNAFFRRKGLFPPMYFDSNQANGENVENAKRPDSTFGKNQDRQRSISHGSAMSGEKAESDRSSITLRGQRLDPRQWQTNSSTGILAAWRDICERQESMDRINASGTLNGQRRTSRATSEMSIQKEPMLWHEGVSFTKGSSQKDNNLNGASEIEMDASDAGEKYWAPIRSYPVPTGAKGETDVDMKNIASSLKATNTHRRRSSRQPSQVRRQQSQPARSLSQRPSRETRQDTPASVNSSRNSSSRRPVHASRNRSQSRQGSIDPPIVPKPRMVEAQVQTTDELMSFLKEDPEPVQPAPVVSKDRRKRAGCFSALDEDMEDLFGPYSDVPLKKARLDEQDELLLRPRVALLREDDEVKKLRAQKSAERAAMPPPISLGTLVAPNPTRTSELSLPTATTDNCADQPSSQTVDTTHTSISLAPDSTLSAPAKEAKSSGPANDKSSSQDTTAEVKVPEVSAISSSVAAPQFDFALTTTPKEATVSAGTTMTKITASMESSDAIDSGAAHVTSSHDNDSGKFSTDKERHMLTTSKPTFTFAKGSGGASAPTSFKFGAISGTTVAPPDGPPKDSNSISLPAGGTHALGVDDSSPSSATAQEPTAATKNAPSSIFLFGSKQNGIATSTVNTKQPNTFGSTFSNLGSKQDLPTSAAEANSISAPKTTEANSSLLAFGAKQTDPAAKTLAPRFQFGQSSSADVAARESTAFAPPATINATSSETQSQDTATNSTFTAVKPESLQTGTGFSFGNLDKKSGSDAKGFGGFGMQPTGVNANPTSQFSFAKPSGGPSFTFGAQATTANNAFGSSSTTKLTFKPNVNTAPGSTAPTADTAFGFKAPNTNTAFGPNAPITNTIETSQETFPFGSAATGSQTNVLGNTSGAPANTTSEQPNAIFGSQIGSSGSLFGNIGGTTKPTSASGSDNTAQQPGTAFSFGSVSQTQQPSTSSFRSGAFSAAAAPSFTFGAPNPAPSTFNFNGGFGANTTPALTKDGPATMAQTSQPAFQFGAPAAAQPAPQFGFGQAQSAPGSGFASPAALSPSIQSATAPGSPNPFTFNAPSGPAATGATGRKIANPRSRLAKGRK